MRAVWALSSRPGLHHEFPLRQPVAGWAQGMCARRQRLFELRGLPGTTGLRIPPRRGRAQLPGGIVAMSSIANAPHRSASSAAHWRMLGLLLLAATVGCGEEPTGPRVGGGTSGTGGSGGDGCVFGCGGSGGSTGSGGSAGTGGIVGTGGSGGDGCVFGCGGSGGSAGSGGTAGSAGTGGIGGSAGVGGTGGAGECVTNALCHTCPDRFICDSDANCFPGYICIPSGCETHGGAAIKQCQPSKAPSCTNVSECPNSSDYECGAVGGLSRCLRVTPGCNPSTESYDCAPGFSCEGGACVDRRVPCNNFASATVRRATSAERSRARAFVSGSTGLVTTM